MIIDIRPEFGYDLVCAAPYAFWLHERGELEKIITHHKDDENAEFPNIEDIQTRDFEEMTFILSIEQGKFIKDFLTFFKSKKYKFKWKRFIYCVKKF